MIIGPTVHAAVTMIDSKKGSMTNRAECAKEHFKNDLKYGAAIAVPAAGVAGAAVYAGLKPNTKVSKGLINIAQKTAKTIGNYLGKIIKKLGGKNIAEKILKNPTKFGAAGLVGAAGLYVITKLVNWANNSGRIDQKYEDSAKIESTTKNVVLDA